MKRHRLCFVAVFLAAGLLLASRDAAAQRGADARTGGFGLGIILGAPTGISAKYYMDRFAIDGGLGVFRGYPYHEGTQLHLDVLWHPKVLANTAHFSLPFYFGVGGRFLDHRWARVYNSGQLVYDRGDTHVGVRVPAGLSMNFKRIPLEVFFELALVADLLVTSSDVCVDQNGNTYPCTWAHSLWDINGAQGARYYF